MENNFYVGIVNHKKKIGRGFWSEKLVLYSDDNKYYTDLLNNVTYTSDISCKDYVIKESLIPTDISQYNTDYLYLLFKYKNQINIKKKKHIFF